MYNGGTSMSFNWKEYLTVAQELAQKDREGYLRTAISRAYYGAFCLARNKKGYKDYTYPDVHSKVIIAFKTEKNTNLRKIGQALDMLRKQRNHADYDEDKKIDQNLTTRMLIVAKKIIELIEKI